MNFSNIFNTNKRQFYSTLKKEGITVSDYYDSNKTYKMFFRRNNRGTNPQGKLRFYYPQDTDIVIGTIFVLKGESYLVISQDGIESDVYYTSMAVRCDTTFSVWINEEKRYVNVPCAVISDKYTITHGSTISMISGSVTVYTGLNSYSEQMQISNGYYNFGGYYKIGNTFQNNGLAYVYMTREAIPPATYSLLYDGITALNLIDGTYQLSYTAVKNGSVVDNPTLTYEVSDSTIATVSSTGLLTMISQGNVIVTAIWTDGNATCKTNISVVDESDPNPPVGGGRIEIVGNVNLRDGYSRTYTAHFYDSDDNEVTDATAIWTITDGTFDISTIEQTILDGNKIKLRTNDERLIDDEATFTLSVSDADGNYPTTSITIYIVE